MTAIQTALATLRRITADLTTANPDERAALLALQADALAVLESIQRKRASTDALTARVHSLETQLADREPAERRAIICRRLGIGRSRYYQLRQSPQNSGLQLDTTGA